VRCNGRDQPGSRDGGTTRSSHDEQRAQRRCEQRRRAAQHAGGRIRTGDPSDKPSTSHTPHNRPRPPSTAAGRSNQNLACQVLPFFVHRRLHTGADSRVNTNMWTNAGYIHPLTVAPTGPSHCSARVGRGGERLPLPSNEKPLEAWRPVRARSPAPSPLVALASSTPIVL
jgi:hypothetical protein